MFETTSRQLCIHTITYRCLGTETGFSPKIAKTYRLCTGHDRPAHAADSHKLVCTNEGAGADPGFYFRRSRLSGWILYFKKSIYIYPKRLQSNGEQLKTFRKGHFIFMPPGVHGTIWPGFAQVAVVAFTPIQILPQKFRILKHFFKLFTLVITRCQ